MPSALRNLLILFCVTLLIAAGLVLALAGTAEGTRLLAEQARRWSGGALEWERIEGSLLGTLRLQGVRVREPALSLDLQALVLDWRPRALLAGRLQIERLEAEGIRIDIPESGEESPPAGPFRPGEVPLPQPCATAAHGSSSMPCGRSSHQSAAVTANITSAVTR